MTTGASQDLLARFQQNSTAKFGFVVYRCTYRSDAEWDHFMTVLSAHTKRALEQNGLSELYPRLDWNVQEDQALDGADYDEVRRRFRTWAESSAEQDIGLPRHHACVMVDEECLQSVLDEENPGEFDAFGVMFVFLVSRYDEYVHGAEAVVLDEGSTEPPPQDMPEETDQVCYTTVGISYLVPRVYSLLNGPGWQNFADPEGVIFAR